MDRAADPVGPRLVAVRLGAAAEAVLEELRRACSEPGLSEQAFQARLAQLREQYADRLTLPELGEISFRLAEDAVGLLCRTTAE